MTDEQIEDVTERTLSIGLRFAKWYIFQYVLLFYRITEGIESTNLTILQPKQSTHRLLYTQNTNIACAKVHQRFDK